MTTFVLVHGAFHGAWCWTPLIHHLHEMGHNAVAMDLPIDDPGADWHDHLQAVMTAAPDVDDAVLVGHSRAGRLLPLVLERRSFAHAVYVCASLPPTEQRRPRLCDRLPMLTVADHPLIRDEVGRDVCPAARAESLYYTDCSAEIRQWAIFRLRPQCDTTFPLVRTWPATPSRYIACRDDRVVNVQWMRAAAREVLGRPAVELPGGHAPFLARPRRLALVLASM